jgi:3-dehydroquinate synthase
MVESLTVNLGERSYPLHFARDLSEKVRAEITALTKAGRKVVALTDRNLARRQADALHQMVGEVPTLVVEPGEESKSLSEYGRVLDFFAEHRGDLGGFAAASYLRGIEFYQIPTTLLAMVDSSVGGKTGINLKAGKNLVGAFHQPKGVFIATRLLDTLPPREFAAGMAEVIKYGLLGDAALLARLEATPLTVQSDDLAAVIRTCCASKAKIVEADERELAKEGGRALLNLGHTFGHAIEQVTGYGTYLHGEAVAVGLAAAARLSARLSLLAPTEVVRVDKVLVAHGLPVRLRDALPLAGLMAAMARDKKVRGGLPRFVVLKMLGEAATQSGVDPAFVEAIWRELGAS